MKTGIEQISEERLKQINKHGSTLYNNIRGDGKHLLYAAITYLKAAAGIDINSNEWPWDVKYFKDEGYVENLKKAGALIAAELDRLNLV